MKKELSFILLMMVISFAVTIISYSFFEHINPSIDSFGDLTWWWIVTSSTVGYGDIVPLTTGGRVIGTFVILIGIFVYTYTISLILTKVKTKLHAQERGQAKIKAFNHVLICEYTAFADELLHELPNTSLAGKDIVLLSALVDRDPYEHVQFVYGVPISPEALRRAKVASASHIVVFSNNRFFEPDSKTLHVVSRIMQLNKSAEIFVELINPDHPLIQELPRNITVLTSDELLYSSINQQNLNFEKYLSEKA